MGQLVGFSLYSPAVEGVLTSARRAHTPSLSAPCAAAFAFVAATSFDTGKPIAAAYRYKLNLESSKF